MNIVHIITGLTDGGAEAVLYRLCTYDACNRHCVISLLDLGKYGPLLQKAEVEVHCLGMRQVRLSLCGLLRLWQILRKQKPDVVQTWMYHADLIGGVMARLAGVRRIFWGIRNSTLESGRSKRSTIFVAHLNAWLSRRVPLRIVCCAQKAAEVHREMGYVGRKMVVIANGYDLIRFSPDHGSRVRFRRDWGVDERTPILGMVGRFDPDKDHENLIRALGLLKAQGQPFRCVLVGRDLTPDNDRLVSWLRANNVGNDVMLLGPRNDVASIMSALDVHVLSSAGEAFPNVLAEAMACGTPCVTTDVGDAAVIVGKTGWVVPPREPQLFSEAIVSALSAREDMVAWDVRSQDARERIKTNFSIETMVRSYNNVWSV